MKETIKHLTGSYIITTKPSSRYRRNVTKYSSPVNEGDTQRASSQSEDEQMARNYKTLTISSTQNSDQFSTPLRASCNRKGVLELQQRIIQWSKITISLSLPSAGSDGPPSVMASSCEHKGKL